MVKSIAENEIPAMTSHSHKKHATETQMWRKLTAWIGAGIAFLGGGFIELVAQEIAHLAFFKSTILVADSSQRLVLDLLVPVLLFFAACAISSVLMLAHFRRATVLKILVGAGCVWFGIGFFLGSKGAVMPLHSGRSLSDQDIIPRLTSVVVGQTMPHVDLPPLGGITRSGQQVPGLNDGMFKGHVTLVNVWGSWCVPCREEVPYLEALSKDNRIQLVGINYKDAAENALRFLGSYGNPFAAIGWDENGRVATDQGANNVPETYLVNRDGRIVYKVVGPLTAESVKDALVPEIERALAQQ